MQRVHRAAAIAMPGAKRAARRQQVEDRRAGIACGVGGVARCRGAQLRLRWRGRQERVRDAQRVAIRFGEVAPLDVFLQLQGPDYGGGARGFGDGCCGAWEGGMEGAGEGGVDCGHFWGLGWCSGRRMEG